MKPKLFLLTLITAALCLRTAADVPRVLYYKITDLGLLKAPNYGHGHVNIGAFALNDAGQVVGGNTFAFLWSGGRRTILGTLPQEYAEDFTCSVSNGINNHGQIVGSSGSYGPIGMSGLQFERGFLYDSGRFRQFTHRDESFEPSAINDRGQVVGLDGYRGFFYENGRLLPLGTLSSIPQGNRSTARAVNNRGQAVGWSTINSTHRVASGELPTHAFLWQRGRTASRKGRMQDLGTLPNCVNSYAYGISDRGKVIGSVSDVSGRPYGVNTDSRAEAFLWRHGRIIGLGTLLGCRSSEAYGINNAGVVVGQSDGKAFLWQGGKMQDLNALIPAGTGWVLTGANAINNKGRIVGRGTFHGQSHAFLLTPAGLRRGRDE